MSKNSQPSISVGCSNTPPARLLAIDPGIHNGWAIFEHGVVKDLGTVDGVEAFDVWLHNVVPEKYGKVDVVVIEDFRLFRGKAKQQIGSRFETVQVIGGVQSWARRQGAELVKQSADILQIAPKFSKMTMPRNHNKSHHISAYNHAFYYLVNNDMRLPEGM
jgi:hypothetical protein